MRSIFDVKKKGSKIEGAKRATKKGWNPKVSLSDSTVLADNRKREFGSKGELQVPVIALSLATGGSVNRDKGELQISMMALSLSTIGSANLNKCGFQLSVGGLSLTMGSITFPEFRDERAVEVNTND